MAVSNAPQRILTHGPWPLAWRDVFYDIMCAVTWDVEFTGEFFEWWTGVNEDTRTSIAAKVLLLRERGPSLGFPYASGVLTSRHAHLRELRVQSGGRPFRVLHAFDPRRIAVLLVGGDRTGDGRFYEAIVARADRLYDRHLAQLREGGEL